MERLHVVEGIAGRTEPAPHPLVAVRWLDAWFDFELAGDEEARADYPVLTVGFLLRAGPVVTLAQELLPDGDGYRAVTHIPRALVVSIDRLDGGGAPLDA
mgnify:FL=1